MNGQFVLVKDGDTIVVLAKTQITVGDPCDEYPYVSQAYRIVADRTGLTLALVPLGERATRVSQIEIDQFRAHKAEEEAGKLGAVLGEAVATHLLNESAS